jgi:glutamate/tyrosine decarboxylase-like PLP-dependent enzyme
MTSRFESAAGPEARAASDMSADEFRAAGHRLIDALADFYASLPARPVTRGESARELRALLPPQPLPAEGRSGAELLAEITPLLFDHSLHNGHPRFFGYITSSAAPLGALADLLAAGINQNCGLRDLAPLANEIEIETVRWLAELIGFPTPCGGLMVSGGNVANIVALLAARRARLDWDLRREGLVASPGRPRVYASRETHTWIQKAADVAGLGTDAIRWIATDTEQRMDTEDLTRALERDRAAGELPFMVVGTAGNVSTGAIDPLAEIAAIAKDHALWFHVDGAYGAPAACLPEAPGSLKALALADSVALDPHKWLYAPIEAACTLVRDPAALKNAFSFRPPYYRLGDADDEGGLDYFEHGLQNTRGFRALQVWLCLRQAGRRGYEARIREDIALAARLFAKAEAAPELEPGTRHLSIATLRYRPVDAGSSPAWQEYLNELNRMLLVELQEGGEAYLSNAVIGERYFLRACIVNFRTRASDVDALIEIVIRLGETIDARDRPAGLRC